MNKQYYRFCYKGFSERCDFLYGKITKITKISTVYLYLLKNLTLKGANQMRKFTFFSVLITMFLLTACSVSDDGESTNHLSGDKPPSVMVIIDDEKYETVLGSYCWGTECVDTAGPVGLLKDKEPIQIEPGAKVRMTMDYTPKPNRIYLSQIKGEDEIEIELDDNQFIAPSEKGRYFYSYGLWWMDDKDKDVSKADAFYAFSLEVK